MAWLIRGSTRHKWHNPLIAPNLYCKSREDIIAAQRPLFAEAHIYKETYGFLPFGIYAHGRAIEDRFWPISGYFINDFEKLPRLIGLAGFYLVPEIWYEIIEKFEPGVHQFKHIPLFRCDGSSVEDRFYAVNICQAHNNVADRERSTAPIKDYPDRKNVFIKTSSTAKVFFCKKAIGNYHMWIPLEISVYNMALSNKLYRALLELGGMETIDAIEIEEV